MIASFSSELAMLVEVSLELAISSLEGSVLVASFSSVSLGGGVGVSGVACSSALFGVVSSEGVVSAYTVAGIGATILNVRHIITADR